MSLGHHKILRQFKDAMLARALRCVDMSQFRDVADFRHYAVELFFV